MANKLIDEEMMKEFGLAEEVSTREPLPDDDEFVCYCRTCKQLVDYLWRGRRKICSVCRGTDLSLATKRSLRKVYNYKNEIGEKK